MSMEKSQVGKNSKCMTLLSFKKQSYKEKVVECSVERNFLLGSSFWRKPVLAYPAHECGAFENKCER